MGLSLFILLLTTTATAAPTRSVAETRRHMTELFVQLDALLQRDCDTEVIDTCRRDLGELSQRIQNAKARVFSDAHARWGPHNSLRRYRMLRLRDRALQLERRAEHALAALNPLVGSSWLGGRTNYAMSRVEPIESSHARPFYIGDHMVSAGLWFDLMKSPPGTSCGRSSLASDNVDKPALCVSPRQAAQMANAMSRRDGLDPVYVSTDEGVNVDLTAMGYRLPTSAQWRHVAAGGETDSLRLAVAHSPATVMSPCGAPARPLDERPAERTQSRSQIGELTANAATGASERWSVVQTHGEPATSTCEATLLGYDEHMPWVGLRLTLPAADPR